MYVLKYTYGRRHAIVGPTNVPIDSGLPIARLEWVGVNADGKADARATLFANREQANAAAAVLRLLCLRGTRGRISVVPADNPLGRRRSAARSDKPRMTDDSAAADEIERVRTIALTLLNRARIAGRRVPADSEVKCWIMQERACGSRGGRFGSQFGIAIHPRVLRDPREGRLIYTVAHELAHVCQVWENGWTDHGPKFMAWLKALCPPQWVAYELSYKPREARRAGIYLTKETAREVFEHVLGMRTGAHRRVSDQLLSSLR
jgi:hypothetical protein